MLNIIQAIFHPQELHKTLRMIIIAIAAVFIIRALASYPAPAPSVPSAPAAAPTAHPVAREAQAAVGVSTTLAQVRGGQVPGFAQPAVRVVHDCFVGFTPAQCFALMQATRPKTAPVMHVNAKLVGPTPAPTPTPGVFSKEQIETMFAVAKSADAAAIGEAHIDVNAKLDYAEVPNSRLCALLTPAGSGICFNAIQHRQLILVAGAIERSSHVAPTLGIHLKLKHTSLSCGVGVYYDRALRPQVQCASWF